jgi:hypothetical protein
MTDPAYQLDPDHPANKGLRDKTDRQIDANAAHRESLLPCSGSTGQPLTPKEPVTNPSETERLFPDQERAQRVLAARKEAGL